MAETCIVCLGDLNASEGDLLPAHLEDGGGGSSASKIDLDASKHHARKHSPEGLDSAPDPQPELVAHLLPCGHNLHNDCLRPWVERANSCPICRASFNMVELSITVGGAVLDSYAVQDKQQVADIDPTMVVEEESDDLSLDPCLVCEEFGEESQLLICDGCDATCHVYCAGLDSIPTGDWFCYSCMENPQILGQPGRNRASRTRQSRGQQNSRGRRRQNRRLDGSPRSSGAWARVWQSVWHRIHLDLDFPFDDEDTSEQEREETQRREMRQWERRFRIAARQGAGDRFRQTASTLLEPSRSRGRSAQPDPESQEELRAWNAFEKARDINDDPIQSNSRKRKSTTASPSEHATEPERILKRPRTRRPDNFQGNGESSSSAARPPEPEPASLRRPSRDLGSVNASSSRPGFLQSLLNEVETNASRVDITANQEGNSKASKVPELVPFMDRASSPQLSSPGASPTASNHPTPRAGTPPPLNIARPSSPTLLSSSVLPVYPHIPEFAPFSPSEEDQQQQQSERKSRPPHRVPNGHSSPDPRSSSSSPPRSKDVSPSRHASSLTFSTKSEIQKMVKAALKPHYADKELSKDEFTDICRDISRMLYERVELDGHGIREEAARSMWQTVASEEVEKALTTLRSASTSAAEHGGSRSPDAQSEDAAAASPIDGEEIDTHAAKEEQPESLPLRPPIAAAPPPPPTQTVVGAAE